jgi:hypothetical protein
MHRDGKPYIGEYLTGRPTDISDAVISGAGLQPSTFCDLIINDLVGLRPRADDTVDVNPLIPADAWDWFCLDGVKYHGRNLTIVWDKSGEKYGKGRGLQVLADGKVVAQSTELTHVTANLP